MESAVIAFSGGVDSSLLLSVAREVIGRRVLAVTAISPTYPREEAALAGQIAKRIGARFIRVRTSETKDKRFLQNPPSRCYFCKLELFRSLQSIADRSRMRFILDGSNVDDLRDSRPGRKAAKELGVRSPLQEAGLTKEEIRYLAKKRGLPNWAKEQLACLASRFPYGTEITPEDLQRVSCAESFLRRLGFTNVRVRHYGALARIEVSEDQIEKLSRSAVRKKVLRKLQSLGYTYSTIDLQGYRTGSLNEVLRRKWALSEK
jgi:uncharacterized protein